MTQECFCFARPFFRNHYTGFQPSAPNSRNFTWASLNENVTSCLHLPSRSGGKCQLCTHATGQQKGPSGTKIFMTSKQCFTTSFSSFAINFTFFIAGETLTEPHWSLPMSYPITPHSPDDGPMLQLLTLRFHHMSMINLQNLHLVSNKSWNQMLCVAVAWCLVLSEGFGSRKKTKNVTPHSPLSSPPTPAASFPPPPPHPRPRAKTTGYAQRGAGAHPATNVHAHSCVSSSLFDHNILSFKFSATR